MKNRSVKHAIYTLKRQFGRTVYLHYRANEGTIDYETGAQTFTQTVVKITHAILLPVNYRMQQQFMMFASNFKFGGELRIGDREVLLDQLAIEPTENDYISYSGKRYQIISVQNLDGHAYHCLLRSTQNEPPQQIFDEIYLENFSLTEAYDVD